MARGRTFRRVVYLAIVAGMVWFFLQANRLLPGSWPGGGDTGMRATPTGSNADPTRVRDAGAPPPPPKKPPEPIRVVVRAADGRVVENAIVAGAREAREEGGAGPGGASALDVGVRSDEDAPSTEPPSAASEPYRPPSGRFSVRLTPRGARVRHSRPAPRAPRTWIVAWPQAAVFAGGDFETAGYEPDTIAPKTNASLLVRIDGKPAAGAEVTLSGGLREFEGTTDAAGTLEIPAGMGLYRARVSAPGRAEAMAYGATDVKGPLVIDLDSLAHVATAFVDEAGAPLGAKAVRIVSADGTTREVERVGETIRDLRLHVPSALAATQRVEIEVEGRPVLRARLADLGARTTVPAGRTKRLVVRDGFGRPVEGARVEAHYAGPAGREPLDAAGPVTVHVTDGHGLVAVPIPSDRGADLVVTTDLFAPYGARSDPGDPAEGVVTLVPGIAIAVEVSDANGKPVEGADVVAVSRAGPTSATRRTRTGADGKATLPPVAAGHLEVYAHKSGLVWGWGVVDATAATPPVRFALAPGRRLHLVVDDWNGLPLAGVRVRPQAPDAATNAALVVDPDGIAWTTDAHGTLVVDDLSGGPFDLALSKDGYEPETVRGFSPSGVWFATMVPTVR